jgi:hypothetical protein
MNTPTLPELRAKRADLVRQQMDIHHSFAGLKNAMKNGPIKYSAIFQRKQQLTDDYRRTTSEIAALNAQIRTLGDASFAKSSQVTVAKLVADCATDDTTAERIFTWFRGNHCSIVAREVES